MKDSEFHQLVDQQMDHIEKTIDRNELDIDCDISGNVMTLEFDDRSQIIINRQEPMHEIWLASKSGGFHFQYSDNAWVCSKTGITFLDMVQQECQKHANETLDWS